ncbi:MAG: cation diffusion facilitator family transporter [Clostridiales bacterium]|nr:cation diffusion facilitator family transporter [Clostridiales bacterium]
MNNTEKQPVNDLRNRERTIVRTGFIGILTNIVLAAFKAVIGILSNSIAVVLDAVNNLSDAVSSVITVIGSKLAGRSPDRKHPLGHGRIEYLTAMVVSGLILYAGITSAVESVKKIINPVDPDYSTLSLIIIGVAVVVKILLGTYVKKQGRKVNSSLLIASGTDSLFDAVISASVLASAVIFLTTGLSLGAYVGVIIAVFIIKAGIEMMIETLGDILGRRADSEKVSKIREILTSEPEVLGAYDIILYNYGPEKDYASVHLELPDTMSVREVDMLTRRVETKVYHETGVILTGVGVYSFNTDDDEAASIRNRVSEIVLGHEWALQMHGFFVDTDAKTMRFDTVVSFEVNREEAIADLYADVTGEFPGYTVTIVPDLDISG